MQKKTTFPPSLATINTVAISSITANSAVSGGSIVSDGNDPITARGICYSTKVNPTVADNKIPDNGSSDNFTLLITGLSPNTTYYIRAYATNSTGTAYGINEENFTTLVSLPTVLTDTTVINSTMAVCKGNITDEGGGTILSRGICYSASPSPTIQDSVVITGTTKDTFSLNLNGLSQNTKYYARAFAINSAGTAYGDEISFQTDIQLFAFGQNYQGGIIFHIDDSGNHGLVAAPSDQSTNTGWGCLGTVTGAVNIGVGAGAQNTTTITSSCTTTGIAADFCASLVLGGYSDWFLPSQAELALMYQNLHAQGVGSFSNNSYWSSTEVDSDNAWSHNFGNNTQNTVSKNSPYSARAIRAF